MKPSNADLSFDFFHSSAETGDTGDVALGSVSGTWDQALVNLSPLPFALLAKEEVSHPP
jgi:hypothetical protein